MKAVNLIPSEGRRGRGSVGLSLRPGYLALALLAVVLLFVTITVITNNTISDRQAKLTNLRQQLASEQALAGRLASYQRFAALAQARAATIRQIVGGRFDWHAALSDLSKVVPADTSLQSVNATVSPSTSAGSGGSSSSLRSALSGPAFDITGCTHTQDDVARLISRLRTMNGVTRVTLQNSAKSGAGATSSTSSTSGGTPASCSSGPSFHLVVFFQPLPTVGATAPGAAGPTQVSSNSTAGAAAAASGAASQASGATR